MIFGPRDSCWSLYLKKQLQSFVGFLLYCLMKSPEAVWCLTLGWHQKAVSSFGGFHGSLYVAVCVCPLVRVVSWGPECIFLQLCEDTSLKSGKLPQFYHFILARFSLKVWNIWLILWFKKNNILPTHTFRQVFSKNKKKVIWFWCCTSPSSTTRLQRKPSVDNLDACDCVSLYRQITSSEKPKKKVDEKVGVHRLH